MLGLDGQGGAQMFADYWQWEQAQLSSKPAKQEKVGAPRRSGDSRGKKKLSYLEAREWEQMEARILEAEQELEAIRAEMQSPDVVSDAAAPARLLREDAAGRVRRGSAVRPVGGAGAEAGVGLYIGKRRRAI